MKKKQIAKRGACGLTLIEVAFASLVVSIVAFAVYGTLSRGIDIWRRVHGVFPQEDVAIFFEKITVDLENSFRYPDLKLTGNATYLTFATFVLPRPPEPNVETMGTASYVFDDSRREIQKGTASYSEVYEAKEGGRSAVLQHVEHLAFSYLFFNKEEERYVWGEAWPPGDVELEGVFLPLAVRIVLRLHDENKSQEYTTAVFLPVA